LDVSKKFEDQVELVKKEIIPIIKKSIDKNQFYYTDSILYELIHQRHRHQRERFLRDKKAQDEIASDDHRIHANGRRSDVCGQLF
jgi:hypothetical protein